MPSSLSKGIQSFTDGEYWGAAWRDDRLRLNAWIQEQWAQDPILTVGLTWAFKGGVNWNGAAYGFTNPGTIGLANNATNYVEHTIAGVVSVNQVGFTAGSVPMAQVTTVAGAVTAVLDRRSVPLGALLYASQRGAVNGVASLDGAGLIPTAQLPPLAITEIHVVGSQAAMLALAAQRGEIAIRTDVNKTFALATDSPGTLGDWKEMLFAGGGAGGITFANTARILARISGGGGAGEEATLSQILDLIGGATRGDLLRRGAASWERYALGTTGKILMSDGNDPVWVDDEGFLPYLFEGGGAVISVGAKRPIMWGFKGEVTRITLLADQAGDFVADIWKDTYANYPPTVADTITAAAKPTLAAAIKNQDAVLTGWTKSFNKGDIWLPNVDSAATVQWVMMIIEAKKVA